MRVIVVIVGVLCLIVVIVLIGVMFDQVDWHLSVGSEIVVVKVWPWAESLRIRSTSVVVFPLSTLVDCVTRNFTVITCSLCCRSVLVLRV